MISMKKEDITHIVVSCSASVEGLGKVSSDQMKIVIDKMETTTTEESVTETDVQEDLFQDFKLASHLYQKENETDEYDYEGYEDYDEDGSVKKDTDKDKDNKEDTETDKADNSNNDYDDKDAVDYGVSKENQLSSSSEIKYEHEEDNHIELSSSDDEDIKIAATDRKQDNDEEFLKAADLPEPRVSNQGDQSSSVLVSK